MKIIVIEDDPVIGNSVLKGLDEAGHKCTWTKNGTQGLELARSQQYDVIILDLLIPEVSGLEILSRIRQEDIHTPVIVLTALGSVEDRVNGLQKGADDYIVKPFAMPELLARIDAVRRRDGSKPALLLEVGELCLDFCTRRVTHGGTEIDLTPTEFSVLEILMRHAGEVVTRKMLCESLWESDWEGTTNVIEVHINRLRSKLQHGSMEHLIHTIRGRGYALRAI